MRSLFGAESEYEAEPEYESESEKNLKKRPINKLPDVGTMGFEVLVNQTDKETNWWR
jgi:hypothetical protein